MYQMLIFAKFVDVQNSGEYSPEEEKHNVVIVCMYIVIFNDKSIISISNFIS